MKNQWTIEETKDYIKKLEKRVENLEKHIVGIKSVVDKQAELTGHITNILDKMTKGVKWQA